MSAKPSMRPLTRAQWPQAMTLAARCFVSEPFVAALFGAEPVRRLELAHRYYQSSQWHEEDRYLGAFVSDVLVGVCLTSMVGNCQVCRLTDPERPPSETEQLADWQFDVNVQAAHAAQGEHAWLRRVAVDPALRGSGIGRKLVAEAVGALAADGAPAVLLECQPHRERFYDACGFRRVGTFPDVAGPDAVLMRMDLPGIVMPARSDLAG
jgi:GNAT superfamily N-acetyltransferase